jgi:hypothetical protein
MNKKRALVLACVLMVVVAVALLFASGVGGRMENSPASAFDVPAQASNPMPVEPAPSAPQPRPRPGLPKPKELNELPTRPGLPPSLVDEALDFSELVDELRPWKTAGTSTPGFIFWKLPAKG